MDRALSSSSLAQEEVDTSILPQKSHSAGLCDDNKMDIDNLVVAVRAPQVQRPQVRRPTAGYAMRRIRETDNSESCSSPAPSVTSELDIVDDSLVVSTHTPEKSSNSMGDSMNVSTDCGSVRDVGLRRTFVEHHLPPIKPCGSNTLNKNRTVLVVQDGHLQNHQTTEIFSGVSTAKGVSGRAVPADTPCTLSLVENEAHLNHGSNSSMTGRDGCGPINSGCLNKQVAAPSTILLKANLSYSVNNYINDQSFDDDGLSCSSLETEADLFDSCASMGEVTSTTLPPIGSSMKSTANNSPTAKEFLNKHNFGSPGPAELSNVLVPYRPLCRKTQY